MFGQSARYSRSDEAHGTSMPSRAPERDAPRHRRRCRDRRRDTRAVRETPRASSRKKRRRIDRRARGRACCARTRRRTPSSSSTPPSRAVSPLFSALRTWLRTLRSSAVHSAGFRRRAGSSIATLCCACRQAPGSWRDEVPQLDVRQPRVRAPTLTRRASTQRSRAPSASSASTPP